MSSITEILSAIDNGDSSQAQQLLPRVYEERRPGVSEIFERETGAHVATNGVGPRSVSSLGRGPTASTLEWARPFL